MEIYDFLPKYPNIHKHSEKEKILDPYDDNFYQAIFKKKEFYDNRYSKEEEFPTEIGELMKGQRIISRILSSNTMYDSMLLIWDMGIGKSCATIGAIEQIKNEDSSINGAYIFAKGKGLLNNFIKELRDKCTAGQYIPENFDKLTSREKIVRTKKMYQDFYSFTFAGKPTTFETFSSLISKMTDNYIINTFSNKILVIDEIHNLREQDKEKGTNMYNHFHRFLHLVENCKIILLSGTPMKSYFILLKYDLI